MNKAIKYRLYPNKEQKTMFAKTFGCVRFIYNKMLTDKIDYYKETKQKLNNTPAQYKEKFPWLREVDSLALANAQLHLQTAYSNFFRDKKIGFPKFKSKSNKQSYTTNNQKGSIKIEENSFVKLPKIGLVKTKIHKLPNENYVIKSVTITKTCSGDYYISILFEFKKNIEPHPIDNVIGLDYKSDGLYVDSEGHTCGSPKYYRKSNKKLSCLQRQLSRKQKGSKNRDKQRNKVAKLSEHISNQRKDFLHKKSTEIANQYDVVCVETLNMKAIGNRKFKNGKATFDNGYGMFLQFLKYKLEDRGKKFIRVDKWYPSSQLCFCCGKQHQEMKNLSIRKFICDCGYQNDRDINSALNIKKEGLRLLERI